MSTMGVKIDQFDVPVCNSFQAKIMNDQLCYEIDLNRFSNKDNIKNELELGFIFLMDYNEDRQFVNNGESTQVEEKSFGNRVVKSDHENHASIILNTIGTETFKMIKINIISCRACDIDWWRGV